MRYAILVLALIAGCSNYGNFSGTETERPAYRAGDTVAVAIVMPDSPDPVLFTVWADGAADQVLDIYGNCTPVVVLGRDADSLYYAVGGFVDWGPVVARNTDCEYDSVLGQIACWGRLDGGDTIYIP